MPEPDPTAEFFEMLAKVLLRCTIFGFVLLLIWFGAIMLAGDLIYAVHGDMFGLTQDQLNVIHYCGLGLTKLCVGVFFFIPWIAIRLVLRKRPA